VRIFEETNRPNSLTMKKIAIAMSLSLAAFIGGSQAMPPTTTHHSAQEETKAVGANHTRKARTIEETIGGIPRVTYYPDYGMSPKEYGMKYGHGNKKGKSNRLRFSHNAKLKRR
jgi:hypothetical protein